MFVFVAVACWLVFVCLLCAGAFVLLWCLPWLRSVCCVFLVVISWLLIVRIVFVSLFLVVG